MSPESLRYFICMVAGMGLGVWSATPVMLEEYRSTSNFCGLVVFFVCIGMLYLKLWVFAPKNKG
jgi:hypothetical protein